MRTCWPFTGRFTGRAHRCELDWQTLAGRAAMAMCSRQSMRIYCCRAAENFKRARLCCSRSMREVFHACRSLQGVVGDCQ